MEFLANLLDLLLEASPWLVFGLVLGGVIKALIPTSFLNRHLSGNSISSIGKAAMLGAPLPLCSCGVIPVALGLRQAGASKPATTSFLVSTPETGIDSITVTYALLGPFMTIVRPIAALASALVSGLLVIVFDKEDNHKPLTTSDPQAGTQTSCCSSEPDEPAPSCSGEETETETEAETTETTCCASAADSKADSSTDSCCSTNTNTNPSSTTDNLLTKAWQGIHYAFTSLLDDIILWLIIGMIFAALANTFLPTDFLAQWGSGILAMLIIMLAGIPMYICATASTPVAAGLMMAGVSPGVALVLMLTGPATNVSTLGVIQKEMGKKTMWLYLLGVSVTALISGMIVNAIIDSYEVNITAQLQEHGQVFEPIQWAALLLLVMLGTRKLILGIFTKTQNKASFS